MGSASSPRKQPEALVATMCDLERLGLNSGSAGNASCRGESESYWITPSGVRPEALTPERIVELLYTSEPRPSDDDPPSSEWRMHRDIYRARPDASAIVHTHSSYATALACLGRAIPPFHYMVAVAGGDSIRCAPYATFGTQTLSDYAVKALTERNACLLANHGLVALGTTVKSAADLALEVELLAKQYLIAMHGGDPIILGEDQMVDVLQKFESYGPRNG